MLNNRSAPATLENDPPTRTAYAQGSLDVVESACAFSADRKSAKIVITSSNPDFPRAIEELQTSMTARNIAIGYAAANGVSDPRINGNVAHPYPVNHQGRPLDEVTQASPTPLPPQHHDLQPAAYRVDIPICNRLC